MPRHSSARDERPGIRKLFKVPSHESLKLLAQAIFLWSRNRLWQEYEVMGYG